MKRFALALLPFVIVANLANNRRASIAALVVSMVAFLLITAKVKPHLRRVIGWSVVVFLILYVPYFAVYQNKTGFIALPARAIASTIHPNAQDASSNFYRISEDLDIMTTVKSSPIIGYGFGKPMYTPYPLPKIGYGFQLIMPHSILWVWMRLGTLGYLFLWLLIGAAIMETTRLARRLRDPWLQGVVYLPS